MPCPHGRGRAGSSEFPMFSAAKEGQAHTCPAYDIHSPGHSGWLPSQDRLCPALFLSFPRCVDAIAAPNRIARLCCTFLPARIGSPPSRRHRGRAFARASVSVQHTTVTRPENRLVREAAPAFELIDRILLAHRMRYKPE